MKQQSAVSPASDILDELDPRHFIIIKGARVNNLKNLSVAIPRNKLVVVTGVSGSGKSSLAFDTLFAEGQRMYVESLSSYARQFLGRMEKPEVEYIRGVSPAIAIEQKVSTKNPRSTVGTTTEIYDYLKLLFARIGHTYSPVSGQEVQRDTVSSVVDFINSLPEGTRFLVLCPFVRHPERSLQADLKVLLSKGYTRIMANADMSQIEDLIELPEKELAKMKFDLLIDRAAVDPADEDLQFRLADSVQTAFFESHGDCIIEVPGAAAPGAAAPDAGVPGAGRHPFSDRFELDGIQFEEPSVNLFTFNNPFGACKTCEGFGQILGIDPDLVIPDKSLSVYEGAIAPWRSEGKREDWLQPLLRNGIRFDFPIHRPYNELSPEEQQLLWDGNSYFEGLNRFFKWVNTQMHKVQYRVLLSRYRGRTVCPDCRGTRLRKDAQNVRIGVQPGEDPKNGKSIADLVLMPVGRLKEWFDQLQLPVHEQKVADRLQKEITNRLDYLIRVGLEYLTLNRVSNTLSGGEFQRIKLSTSLGSALVGSMYILDEPSIGLHPRDTTRLVSVLELLRNLGNTVIVVEHEEEVMRMADQIIDIGPDAGTHGGELVFQGTLSEMMAHGGTHTARYLSGRESIKVPKHRRPWRNSLWLRGCRENNLQNIDVQIPLEVMTCITGVSGSGKSTLVKKILYPAVGKLMGSVSEATGKFDKLEGDYKKITQVEFVDQNPIGKSSRSNPVTYVKAYDAIRNLYSEQALAKARGYKQGHFSFNVDGGRCEICQGEGVVTVEMQFMADIHLTCEGCGGKRFKQEILDVKFRETDIAEVLDLTVDDALEFFKGQTAIINKLQPLQEVGLGYITLGQSSNSLSGGEAQRVKLASFLAKGSGANSGGILFIFDEPTTGLHFHDISKLLHSINALIEQGNTAVIIEHNMEMIKSADWILDLGPEGGEGGGKLEFAGTPEEMAKLGERNYTAKYLREKL
jgi:excinuclease ABC subunit A